MDQYKKKLGIRTIYLGIYAAFAALLCVYDAFFASTTFKSTPIYSFLLGALTSTCILAVLLIVKYRKILADDSKLNLEYNKETDERLIAIRGKAGIPMIPVLSILLLLAGIIAGHVNITVFYTLIISAMCQLLLCVILKLYYLRAM